MRCCILNGIVMTIMHYVEAVDEVSPSNVAERVCCRVKAHSQVDCLVYATTLVFWSEYSGTSSRHGMAAFVFWLCKYGK
jgi:hypothetical protein